MTERIEEMRAKLAEYEKAEADRKEAEEMKAAARAAGISEHEIAAKLVDRDLAEKKGLNAAMEQLAGQYDFLKTPKGSPKQIGGGPLNVGESTPAVSGANQQLAEAAEKARKSGRPEDRVAYARLKRQLGDGQ